VKLYLKLYLAVLASLALFALAAILLWHGFGHEWGPPRRAPGRGLGGLLLILLAVAAGAYPVVRRLTRRLEKLQAAVESLGSGDLSARVKVEGRDEVGRLAQSFNAAAARIERLVATHKALLANTSHELRTPLARLRMALELGKEKRDIERDIAEIDALIDEILVASRLDAGQPLAREEVDLLGLAAEECARYESVAVEGEPALLQGDPRLLRRMVRNLVENALHHGTPPVCVRVRRDASDICLRVEDAGSPIPPAERERLFEPFYRREGTRDAAGTGLGLSIVRQIARRHGGDARYDGQAFEVRLGQPSVG
jgi:signal transduction histidine kinase